MKDLKNNLSYKVYENGKEFLEENSIYLNANINTFIETAFFFHNAQNYHKLNHRNYALRFKNGEEILLILRLDPFNMLVFGSKALCKYAVDIMADLNLVVGSVLGEEECIVELLKCYQKRLAGEIYLQHSMQIMVLKELKSLPNPSVFQCSSKDLEQLALCYCSFKKEALQEVLDLSSAIEALKGKENTFYAIKEKDKIVSIAAKARNFDSICSISNVFTIPEYRGKGYARGVVSKICEGILEEGKRPYLFVDTTNPISNHLYLSLGFTYLINQVQYLYSPTIKTAVFAGGCFWCVAEPFYALDGVKKVVSGFVGGKEILPSYTQVKQGATAHREAILIEYDSEKIEYSTLLEIYFSSIDPFDDGGQYIDRGHNYTCGIYTSNLLEQEKIQKHIKELEQQFNQKVYVDICEDTIFYPAEEEHQDYALKHPEEIKEEFEISGRLNRIRK
ncbi:MAG: peptide-methionine (S)-S-oxide reductase MsrA [Anaeroplasmataceae bacterium]|nr:peptide-methionine (S)-S-oxide reductase MsrA [Anaeroplasmataceae bacterium]